MQVDFKIIISFLVLSYFIMFKNLPIILKTKKKKYIPSLISYETNSNNNSFISCKPIYFSFLQFELI